jgi:hypothetical protein
MILIDDMPLALRVARISTITMEIALRLLVSYDHQSINNRNREACFALFFYEILTSTFREIYVVMQDDFLGFYARAKVVIRT